MKPDSIYTDLRRLTCWCTYVRAFRFDCWDRHR